MLGLVGDCGSLSNRERVLGSFSLPVFILLLVPIYEAMFQPKGPTDEEAELWNLCWYVRRAGHRAVSAHLRGGDGHDRLAELAGARERIAEQRSTGRRIPVLA